MHAVIRGEKTRKEYAALLQRHKAAVIIQKQIKAVFVRNKVQTVKDATIVIQSG